MKSFKNPRDRGAESSKKRFRTEKGEQIRLKDPKQGGEEDFDEDILSFDDPFLDEVLDESKKPQVSDQKKSKKIEKVDDSKVFLPNQSKSKNPEQLEFENSAYTLFHRFTTWWPIPSFDIVTQQNPSQNPLEVYVVGATQIRDPSSGKIGQNSVTKKPEKFHFNCWKFGNMYKTINDSDDDEDLMVEDDPHFKEDPTIFVEKCVLEEKHGDQNRIRIMPQKNNIVCMFCEGGQAVIYDITNPIFKVKDKSDLRYVRKKEKQVFVTDRLGEGFGLCWSPLIPGTFAVGGKSKNIHYYQNNESGWSLGGTLKGHSNCVEDIVFSPCEKNVMASCGCDGNIIIWDVRAKKAGLQFKCSNTDVNVIDWNKEKNFYICSGDDEGAIKIWDFRKIVKKDIKPVGEYNFHKRAVTSIEWNPKRPSMIASTSEEDICVVWDLSVESENQKDRLQGVPDQVMFIHMGQKEMKEVHWHKNIDNLLLCFRTKIS